MSRKLKQIVLEGIKKGMGPMSMGVNLCINKAVYGITQKDYTEYCKWAIENESFWYWLQQRLRVF